MEANEMLVRAELYTLNCISFFPNIMDEYIMISRDVCTMLGPLFLALGGSPLHFHSPPAGK